MAQDNLKKSIDALNARAAQTANAGDVLALKKAVDDLTTRINAGAAVPATPQPAGTDRAPPATPPVPAGTTPAATERPHNP